jgi:ACS family hexuronate transporter-like MFS transporter
MTIQQLEPGATLAVSSEAVAARHGPWRYENALLAILATGLGFTILDRIALGLLSPFILPDLGLNDADLGWIAAALSVTLALSGYVFGAMSDRLGRRSRTLGLSLLIFSLCSSITGLATGFFTMVGARLVMGLTEGPILPLCYSIMAIESSPKRRGFNHGVLANFGTCLVGGIIGPLVLVKLAVISSWRVAFLLAGVPGLVIALTILRFVREPGSSANDNTPVELGAGQTGRPSEVASIRRNVILCAFLLSGLYTWLLVTITFLPRYLVQVTGLNPGDVGWVTAAYGASGCTLAIGVSWLADRIGRKATCVTFSVVGLLVPVGVLAFSNNVPAMVSLIVVGWSFIGCSPLFAGTIPAESVSSARVAKTLAVIIGIAEIVGGVVMTGIAGEGAEHYGLAAPFWIVAVVTALTAVGSLFLVETKGSALRA